MTHKRLAIEGLIRLSGASSKALRNGSMSSKLIIHPVRGQTFT
jgi:hypothetical protein